jgi:hypothetical protein
LLHLEPEIDERTDTMVFSVYARGRVNPPAIGTGISADELERQVKFVLGPCACTIKHDNPGMDLALVANWDEIAFAMAKKYGSETGNEKILDDVPGLFPEVVETKAAPDASAAANAAAADANPIAAATANSVAAASNGAARTEANGKVDASESEADDFEGIDEGAKSPPTIVTLFESGSVRVFVAMLVVAVVLLGGASLVLFRRPA